MLFFFMFTEREASAQPTITMIKARMTSQEAAGLAAPGTRRVLRVSIPRKEQIDFFPKLVLKRIDHAETKGLRTNNPGHKKRIVDMMDEERTLKKLRTRETVEELHKAWEKATQEWGKQMDNSIGINKEDVRARSFNLLLEVLRCRTRLENHPDFVQYIRKKKTDSASSPSSSSSSSSTTSS